MPRKIRLPIIPFSSVGDIVTADNGLQYIIIRVDGAKAWMKHPDANGKVGRGRPRYGIMEQGSPDETKVTISGESEMAGLDRKPYILEVDIL